MSDNNNTRDNVRVTVTISIPTIRVDDALDLRAHIQDLLADYPDSNVRVNMEQPLVRPSFLQTQKTS